MVIHRMTFTGPPQALKLGDSTVHSSFINRPNIGCLLTEECHRKTIGCLENAHTSTEHAPLYFKFRARMHKTLTPGTKRESRAFSQA